MTKLCVVDLDGVVANVDARFAEAEEAKAEYLDSTARNDLSSGFKHDWNVVKREATDLYWRTVFNPDLVSLDTLIDGANEAIVRIEEDYQVVYLTSRPETMRAATFEWLLNSRLSGPKLVMKPSAFQYTKTVIWKAGSTWPLSGARSSTSGAASASLPGTSTRSVTRAGSISAM